MISKVKPNPKSCSAFGVWFVALLDLDELWQISPLADIVC